MRVVIVDDHPLVRQGLSFMFSIDRDIQIAGEAANVTGALALIEREHPDIAIVDLKLGDESGLEIVRRIKEQRTECSFLVLTSSAAPKDFKQAEQLGVEGYVLKEALPEEFMHAIRLISKGRKYYDPFIVDLVVNDSDIDPVEELTPREREVLLALSEGLKNVDIAKKLFVTEYTVKKHVSQILEKLCLRDRTQAALYAYEKGLIDNR